MAAGKATGSRGVRLQFKQKLVSSPTKQLSTTEVLKRLKNLHKELVGLDQDVVVTDSLNAVTRELIQSNLIKHKDKGVKSYVASCLADLLRLYAPDAPYTDRELKEIFEFFVEQLEFVTDDADPYFDAYFYLLENLANVKILLLILDLQNSEELMTKLFRKFFSAIKINTPKLVQGYFVDIMQQLIEDAPALPQEVIDVILYHFLRETIEENPAAYQLASAVCRATTDKLQNYVCQYFMEAIVAEEKSRTTAQELHDFKTAHDLIKELNRSAPGLLLNVIPQLEEELKLDDLNLRMLATQVLGEMLSEKGSTLALRNETVWRVWLSRRNDKAAAVRTAWAEYCIPLYHNHPELSQQVNDAIKSKMSDPDEKVRIAFCKVLGQIDYETVHKLVDADLLIELAKRCRDRKHGVRQEAINALARLYNMGYPDIINNDEIGMSKFNWIPTEILNTLYTNDNEIVACVEKALEEAILPPNNENYLRIDRILNVLESMDGKATKGFFSLFQRQRDAISDMEVFMRLSEDYKGESDREDDEKLSSLLDQIIKRIANKLPDPPKTINHLSGLAKIKNPSLYKLIKNCMDPMSDYKTVLKSKKDALKIIEELSASFLETFSILLRRISLTIINHDLIPGLLNKMKFQMALDHPDQSRDTRKVARDLIKDISSRFPALYRPYLDELMSLIFEDVEETLVVDSLEALSHFSKAFPDETPQDNLFKQRLAEVALNGLFRQAKYATIILGQMRDRDQIFADLLQKIVPSLSADSKNLMGHLCVLQELALYSSNEYEEQNEAIANFIVKELILKNTHQVALDDRDWVEDEDLDDECKAKVTGLKILVNRLLVISEEKSSDESVKSVIKLLWRFIRENGEILPDQSTSKPFLSRLRLAAARALLKLARQKSYDKMISATDFQELALMIQDPCYQVRYGFAARLIKYCGGFQLSARFLSIFFLIAHEPAPDIRDMVRVFLIRHLSAVKVQKNAPLLFEMSLVRLIYLLSYHPDFSSESNYLADFTKYIDFFLETIANAENISFLYYITGRIKQVQDANPYKEDSENLYLLSDLTQHIIREKCKTSSWTLLSYPGQVKLPGDLFKSLPNAEISKQIMKRNYIPPDFMKILEKRHMASHTKQEKVPRKPRAQSSKQSPKKRRKLPVGSTTPTRKSTPRAAKAKVLSMEEIEESQDEEDELAIQTDEGETDKEMDLDDNPESLE